MMNKFSALALCLFAACSHGFTVLPASRSAMSTVTRSMTWKTQTAYDALPPKPYHKEEEQEEAKPDEIKETVRALFRVFQLGDKASGNDYPALSHPTGWSGEIGDGPKTAYDCLPPKPFKKAAVVEPVTTKAVEEAPKKDEVRETVRALFRVFQLGDKASGNDYPALSHPTGWSGEIGDGPKTAYDCLPPKKYKDLSP